MIVLNENEWAQDAIESRSLGKQPFETLYRVARYYLDSGYTRKEVRKMLDEFVLQCDNTASIPKWSAVIDFALGRAVKHPALCEDSIDITAPEMEIIQNIKGRQLQRLAFTLLCLAKYWDLVNPVKDHWVNTKDNEIMRMADINTSIKRQSAMYAQLHEMGLVAFSKKVDNTNVRVCFIRPGDTALSITDFRNLGYQYLRYCGEPYITCDNCGLTVRLNDPAHGRKQRYCKACAAEIATQQRVNSVMRQRQPA